MITYNKVAYNLHRSSYSEVFKNCDLDVYSILTQNLSVPINLILVDIFNTVRRSLEDNDNDS